VNAMKTSTLVVALLGAAVVVVGCARTEDEVDSTDLAVTQAAEDDDEFAVQDRMGRPEMTNVTIGAGLVRLRVAKGTFAAVQAQAAAETDPTKRDELAAKAKALGAELKRLADELGTPESVELKSGLVKDAETAAAEAKQVEDAKQAGKPAPTFPRRPSAFFRAYNHQHTFHPKAGERADAKRMLAAGIRALDTLSLDGVQPDATDWSEIEIGKIAEVLSEDALIVDLQGDCTKDTQSYFALEREAFQSADEKARNVASCGGRTLNDDIIDDTLTMWVKKSFDFEAKNPSRVGDHVIAVTVAEEKSVPELGGKWQLSPATDTFPYLGAARSEPFVGLGACSVTCRSKPPATSSSATTPAPEK